tara:strand:+ start:3203 stop:3373 length:171 start_codon:yes stop_codon:yes gene_type:complete
MTDGNLHALAQHEAEREAWEASQEPCDICGEVGCDCAEDYANAKADHATQEWKDGQ